MTFSRLACGIVLPMLVAAPAIAQTQPPPAPPCGTVQGQPAPHGGYVRILRSLNLTADQNQRIQAIIDRYRQIHPPGGARDPDAMRALRQQVMQILTPAQRQRLQAQIQQLRARYSQQQEPVPEASPSPQP
jgi:Spy/CpxP family protein refolding chaperone